MSCPDTEILMVFEELYRLVTKNRRDLRVTDRLQDDLAIDSLAAMELMVALEDRFQLDLIERAATERLQTVGDVLGLIRRLQAAGTKSGSW
jgi:acyl carrier protein